MKVMLGEKIMNLRKQKHWSQEELANRLEISRQAVSKWESGQSVPDLERIIQLSELFDVTTDYLLRDAAAQPPEPTVQRDVVRARYVSMEAGATFLDLAQQFAGRVALGVLLCIFSPICLLILAAGSATGAIAIGENAATAVGLIVLLLMAAAAVAIFIHFGMRIEDYEFLEKEPIEADPELRSRVEVQKAEFRPVYLRGNIIGACLCVLSPVPIFLGIVREDPFFTVAMVCVTLLLVGLGVFCFVRGGVRWSAMQKLLQEGDYTLEEKRVNRLGEKIAPIYWLSATAIYLAWSFVTDGWNRTWILWPVAGVLFVAVMAACGVAVKRQDRDR